MKLTKYAPMLNQNSLSEIFRSESLNVRSLLISNYIFQPYLFHVHKNLPSTRADALHILMHKNLRIVSAGNLMSYHILSAYFPSSSLPVIYVIFLDGSF